MEYPFSTGDLLCAAQTAANYLDAGPKARADGVVRGMARPQPALPALGDCCKFIVSLPRAALPVWWPGRGGAGVSSCDDQAQTLQPHLHSTAHLPLPPPL